MVRSTLLPGRHFPKIDYFASWHTLLSFYLRLESVMSAYRTSGQTLFLYGRETCFEKIKYRNDLRYGTSQATFLFFVLVPGMVPDENASADA